MVSGARVAGIRPTYLEHPCVNYANVVVVICGVFLEFLHAAFQVDLFPLVLEHLPVDGAFLVFLRATKSANLSLYPKREEYPCTA